MSENMTIEQWFAAELATRMKEMNIKPYQLMVRCDMKESELDACLKGKRLPRLYSLVLLADLFECTVNDLLGFDEIDDIEVYEQYTASSMYFADYQYAICLSYRMRHYLEDRFMTIADLIVKLGLSDGTVRQWFAKTHPHLPTTANLLHICDVLGCTPTELLGY